MEIKKIHEEFCVCQVEDYSLVNWECAYCFIGKVLKENFMKY